MALTKHEQISSAPSNALTADRLRELLNYDPETGVFTWRVGRKKCRVGAIAGCLSNGYIAVMLEGRYYRCHRLAWLHFYGVKHHIGTFDTIEEASAAYVAAKRAIHIGCTI